ncbi:hypothetical protein [Reyranella sp.]|uniref:hypothetical protein n=1 Tax=Reyranella sp. TaxID=1929291 RepID=UPI003BA9C05E
MPFYKDEVLDVLAESGNVAQFASFRPTESNVLLQTYCRVAGHPPNYKFSDPAAAVAALLSSSPDGTVNVRSFAPNSPRSQEFVYGIGSVDEVLMNMARLAKAGLCLIVNETIDVADGGVSGVVQGNVVEFAPDDTPRCVEKPGVASLPYALGIDMLSNVYGFAPELSSMPGGRLEFSVHPKPRGWRQTHTLLWEKEAGVSGEPKPAFTWPNRFSRHIGDKAFGLLVATYLGVPVPRTLVISRRVRPFQFGSDTGSLEVWTRTCPAEPLPGLYTTVKGWADPFALLAAEDPKGTSIRSVLCQSAVPAAFSGAAIVTASSELLIEGRHGEGDRFMLGLDGPEILPTSVTRDVSAIYSRLTQYLGEVRFEWVHDGERAWIVQLHCGGTATSKDILVPGDPSSWINFDVALGLEALRYTLESLPDGAGIVLVGDIGFTSHMADLTRKAAKPARLARSEEVTA